MPNCIICNQSHSSPHNLLLTCATCTTPYHHRHHTPPVSDRELIDRLKATKQGNLTHGIASWTCANCAPQILRVIPGIGPGKAPRKGSNLRPHTPNNNDLVDDNEVIVISDDDSPPVVASNTLPAWVIDLSLTDDDDDKMDQDPIPTQASSIPDQPSHEHPHEHPQAPIRSENTPQSFLAPPWLNEAHISQSDLWDRAKSKSHGNLHGRRKSITKFQAKPSHKPSYISLTSWLQEHKNESLSPTRS